MRTLLPFLCLLSVPAFAQFPLNDTGQDLCFEGGDRVACTEANTGDASTHPRQDGRFGRDAQAGAGTLVKQGAGAAGFDFTKVCNSGQPASTGTCPADPMLGAGEDDWACTRDNVTGRVWEVKVNDNNHLRHRDHVYAWFDGIEGSLGSNNCNGTLAVYSNQCNTHNYRQAVNAAVLCGYTDWRLPTRRELFSIIDHGATSSPRIDPTFFPNAVANWYWSSDIYAPNDASSWRVTFNNGNSGVTGQTTGLRVRLVRGGQ